jgi:hypothetical protein
MGLGILLLAAACNSTAPVAGQHELAVVQNDAWQFRGNYAQGSAGSWTYDEATGCNIDPETGWTCTSEDTPGSLTGTATLTGSGNVYRGLSISTSSYAAGPYRSAWRSRYNGSSVDATMTLDATVDGAAVAVDGSWGTIGNSNSGSVSQTKY